MPWLRDSMPRRDGESFAPLLEAEQSGALSLPGFLRQRQARGSYNYAHVFSRLRDGCVRQSLEDLLSWRSLPGKITQRSQHGGVAPSFLVFASSTWLVTTVMPQCYVSDIGKPRSATLCTPESRRVSGMACH